MKVYKFGGASIADPGRMLALLPIISDEQEPLLIVLSALGKTTNALELIVNSACQDSKVHALQLADTLKQQHLDYARQLLNDPWYVLACDAFIALFNELDTAVKEADGSRYDESYDQIVCMGELFSSLICSLFLQQHHVATAWVDIRKVIHTDDTYRDAAVSLETSQPYADAIIGIQLKAGKVVVTQGFIGAAPNGRSVTLGREGSDYTAALLAAILGMESLTIWKDVNGFRNADPKLFPDTVKLDAISYTEVIEMAFYGAQIIHPKTIKPLQNSNIPLYVKCFLDKEQEGSVICAEVNDVAYPPLIVLKDKQVLIQVTTKDFSFITEDNLSRLYSMFHALKIKINLIQNAAISFVACIDDREDKISALIQALQQDYSVTYNKHMCLLTVRHYTTELLFDLTKGKQVFLQQETRKTAQLIFR